MHSMSWLIAAPSIVMDTSAGMSVSPSTKKRNPKQMIIARLMILIIPTVSALNPSRYS